MQEDQHDLKSGSILKNYTIIRVLGEGGFGITYLAKENELGMEVVIKEYFPNEFAMRSTDSTITAKSKSLGDYSKGMQRFKEEAQILAKFNHPSIVKILGYFEANNTAYFVMEYEEGIDLSQYLKERGNGIGQEEILSIMMPILEGLKEVHTHKYLHRDIKPGNILLRNNKSPVLIDFGASKLAIGEASKSITSMLTEGYAPLEQYSTDIKKQGPYTDLYAIAAVMYKMITGAVPPSSQTRSYALLSGEEDPYRKLVRLELKGYDKSFLKAVDRALSISAKERPQNVQEFQKDIAGELELEQVHSSQPTTKIGKNSNKDNPKKSNNGILIGLLVLILIAGSTLGYMLLQKEDLPQKVVTVEKENVKKVQEAKKIKVEKEKKEAEEIVRKVMEEVEKEKNVVKSSVTPVIAKAKNAVWDRFKAEQIVLKKMSKLSRKKIKNFYKSGYPLTHDFKNKIKIKFFSYHFVDEVYKIAVATSKYDIAEAVPYYSGVSFFIFSKEKENWYLKQEYYDFLEGSISEVESIEVVEIGKGKEAFAVITKFDIDEVQQTLYFVLYDGITLYKSLLITYGYETGSFSLGESVEKWQSKFEFVDTGKSYYDLSFLKKGIINKKPFKTKIMYIFDEQNKQYTFKQKTTNKSLKSKDISNDCVNYKVSGVKQLNVRINPDSNAKIIGRINEGEEVCLSEFDGKWGKDKKGWISGKFLYILNTKNNIETAIKVADKKPLFIGRAEFNFMGGNGTGESIEIIPEGKTILRAHGTGGTTVTYKGEFTNPLVHGLPNYRLEYLILGNKIYIINSMGLIDKVCGPTYSNYVEAKSDLCMSRLYFLN